MNENTARPGYSHAIPTSALSVGAPSAPGGKSNTSRLQFSKQFNMLARIPRAYQISFVDTNQKMMMQMGAKIMLQICESRSRSRSFDLGRKGLGLLLMKFLALLLAFNISICRAFSPHIVINGNVLAKSYPLASRSPNRISNPVSLKMVDIGSVLFNIDQIADSLVTSQLQHLSPISALVLYGAGVATSLSPCALSVLPLTVGFLGGSQDENGSAVLPSVAFSLGLATVLCILGLIASFFGSIYGILVSLDPIFRPPCSAVTDASAAP
jgi:hypothetical protein